MTVKVSQNLHAEVFLREVAVAAGRAGSREVGLAEWSDFLTGLGKSEREHPSPKAPATRAARWSHRLLSPNG